MTSGSTTTSDSATTVVRPERRATMSRHERWAAAMAAIVLPGMVVLPLPAAAFVAPATGAPGHYPDR
ncbi:hypothetical protein [Nocardia nova]|uniref:hypothetical protein n=1 Tax=Nocardia nova TaxID=37330 RepID=UPI0011DC98B7|nr:hypothetical protein [Nocardia nova]